MKLKEVIKFVVDDKVVIDKELGGGDWINLYSGVCYEVPANLLESEVQLIAPLSRNAIEITIL